MCVIGFIAIGMPTGNISADDCDFITLNYVANLSSCLTRQQQACAMKIILCMNLSPESTIVECARHEKINSNWNENEKKYIQRIYRCRLVFDYTHFKFGCPFRLNETFCFQLLFWLFTWHLWFACLASMAWDRQFHYFVCFLFNFFFGKSLYQFRLQRQSYGKNEKILLIASLRLMDKTK